MPVYKYECEECGHTADKLREFKNRDAPLTCGECGSDCIRVTGRIDNGRTSKSNM